MKCYQLRTDQDHCAKVSPEAMVGWSLNKADTVCELNRTLRS